ncbi:MAG TPA: DUF357 domain-containing protein [Candidatus Aenigmarchaeota archaeon]|nr:DUF357 domain-containing protein [Candidatus Aenigmarchaeota archaeon]
MEELARREKERVELALKELKVKDERANSVMELVNSYKEDADYFFSKGKHLEAFELYVYIFGLLDALARLDLIDPGRARHLYKI